MQRTLAALLLLSFTACAGPSGAPATTPGQSGDDLTSVGGNAKTLEWDAFVYADPSADDATLQAIIARQVKSSLGSLREISIGISDRGASHNLDPAGWTRDLVDIVDKTGATVGRALRVRYHYKDTALVAKNADPGAAFTFTVLVGDYTQQAASSALQPACVDEATDGDSLWYHFQPGQPACLGLQQTEAQAIATDGANLKTGQIAEADAQRRFEMVRAKLTPLAGAPTKYPEYDRLWGFGSDRRKLIVYAFVGVTSDEHDSHDEGAIEYQRLLRTLRAQYPQLSVTYTQPSAFLLDFYVDGQKLPNVTWEDVQKWMIDEQYPPQVGSDAHKIEALRQQVIANFSERFIYWDLPVTVTRNGDTRSMTVEIRTFWGKEDGDPDAKQRAEWRYLEAFWYGDVFAYAGHSHFGHGPLEPTNYNGGNFPDRYQVMLVNSCLSYNYYDLDFIAMHPEQSRDLEVVMNGLPAWWNGMGESTGRYILGLLDGTNKSWAQLLDSMRIVDPYGNAGYEPMRGVNGELDNVFDPAEGAIAVTVGK